MRMIVINMVVIVMLGNGVLKVGGLLRELWLGMIFVGWED